MGPSMYRLVGEIPMGRFFLCFVPPIVDHPSPATDRA
jgi:hypothetical protein